MKIYDKSLLFNTIFSGLMLGCVGLSPAHAKAETALTIVNADDNPDIPCHLAKGYHLPEDVEFADECSFTDMPEDEIRWLVTKKEDIWSGKYGFVDNQGKVVIPIKYSRANAFMEGVANVELDGKWGYINPKGEYIIPAKYAFASRFRDGLAKVAKVETGISNDKNTGRKFGYINHDDKVVIPFQYDNARDFFEGYASVSRSQQQSDRDNNKANNDKWGIIDKTGKVIVPFEYNHGVEQIKDNEAGWKFRATQFLANKKLKEYIFDEQGNRVLPMYDEYGFIKEGLVNVKKGDKWGFVNKDNKVIHDFVYEDSVGFFQGLAKVKQNNKYGFINPEGKAVIPIEYDMIHSSFFQDEYRTENVVIAQKADNFYLLYKDRTTEQLEYDYVGKYFSGWENDLLVVGLKSDKSKNSDKLLYGVINKSGEIVIPIDYLFVDFPYLGIHANMPMVMTLDEKVYILDGKGNIIADQTEEYMQMMRF